jgi:hypothetical protein
MPKPGKREKKNDANSMRRIYRGGLTYRYILWASSRSHHDRACATILTEKGGCLMKLGRNPFGIAIFFIVAVMVCPCFLQIAQAFREERGGRVGGGVGEGEVVVGPRGGAAAEGRDGGVIVRRPQGNVYVDRAVGDRVAVLPDSANSLIVGDQTYYVDDSGVYYLPCSDDITVYCVVPDPQ